MSDFRAISGVSETLQTLLLDRMELPDGVTATPVTLGPPVSPKDPEPQQESPRLNLFLYRVTENGFLRNQEIADQGSAGAYGHPPLSLNLHYLLTPYGNVKRNDGGTPPVFDDMVAQRLLGSAMRVLHDVPVVTDGLTTVRAPSGQTILHVSLRGEVERVKLTIEPLSLEDITKVWTALTLRYRLSTAYVASVVRIESRRPRRFPRPVGQPASTTTPPLPGDPPGPGPTVHVLTIQTPTITGVTVRRPGQVDEQPFPYARIGDTLVLHGTSLSGPDTTVAFDDVRVPASNARGDRVEAVIPDDQIPGAGPIAESQRLQPGARSVRVTARDPGVPHPGFTSNDAMFMLVPGVDPAAVAYAAGPPRRVTVTGTRLVGPVQRGETIIGRSAVTGADYLTATPTRLDVPIPDTLPARGVRTLLSAPLPDPVVLGPGAQVLDVDIGGATGTVTANLATSVPRADLAQALQALIHDAVPKDARFTGTRVTLLDDRLVIVPGGLVHPITVGAAGASTFANDLGLTAAQPAGAGSAFVSGQLTSPPPLSSPDPRVTLTIGGRPPVTVAVPRTTSLVALASAVEAAIHAAGTGPAYLNTRVTTVGSQLLLIPGSADPVTFAGASGDDATVVELQLRADFAVRVRVNGAESTDDARLELPR
jgi:hypothetical protein